MIRWLLALLLAVCAAAPAAAAVVRYDFAGSAFSYTQSIACPTMSSCVSNDVLPSENGRAEGSVAIDTGLLDDGEVYLGSDGYEARYGGEAFGTAGGGAVTGGLAVTGGGLPDLTFESNGTHYFEVSFEPGSPSNRTSIFAQQRQVVAREFDADTGAVIHELLRYMQIGAYIYDAPIELFGSISLPAIIGGFRSDISAVTADQEFFYDPFGNMTGFFSTTRQTSITADALSRSVSPDAVPEPASLGLLGAGLLALGARRRRRVAA